VAWGLSERVARVLEAGHDLPQGGCPMGPTSTEGVIDPTGRVFNTVRGQQSIHRGLYVMDGSIIPGRSRCSPR
jgi:hypothetical protein